MPQFTKKEIEALVLAAAAKLNKEEELKRDKKAMADAMNYFQQNSQTQPSNIELANTALLGVMSVYIAGAIKPIVRYDWGDLTSAPKFNPFSNPSGGGAVIGQGDRMEYTYNDSLGTKANAVANLITKGKFAQEFVEYLEEKGFKLGEEIEKDFSPFKIPKPKPE